MISLVLHCFLNRVGDLCAAWRAQFELVGHVGVEASVRILYAGHFQNAGYEDVSQLGKLNIVPMDFLFASIAERLLHRALLENP
jgi:hypothetical protein